MNPERWAEITKSFDIIRKDVETSAPVSFEGTLSPLSANGINKSKRRVISHYHDDESSNVINVSREKCVGSVHQDLISCRDESKVTHGLIYTDDDVQGKIIADLCQSVREKEERIKIQQRMINALCEKLKGKSVKDTVVQTETNKDHISSTEELGQDSLEKLTVKIENLESRLNMVACFIQRKYPKESVLISDHPPGRKKTDIGAFALPTWYRPPTVYPRHTTGSLMRESYWRDRFYENDNSNAKASHKDDCSNRRPPITIYSKIYKGEEVEQRLQALESLVVLLKDKLMKKINSRRKRV